MASDADFLKGAQLVVEAMLQSPNFLFRLESSPDAKWKPWATASRLSYALWDTMPDATLIAAASHGDLSTREGVEKIARRMLTDPRAKEALNEYTSQWLRFDRLLTSSKDRRKFPLFTRETANAMTEEARTFVSDLVWNDHDFMTLFTADYGHVSQELARIYGVTPPAKDFDRVAFPADIRARGNTRRRSLPRPHGEARRFIPHRPRPFRAGTISLPARARSSARSRYQFAARHGSAPADQSRPHDGTCEQSFLRVLP